MAGTVGRFMGRLTHALLLAVLVAIVLLPGAARASDGGVQTTWRLLDYIAVDYAGAVSGGRIVNQFEYDEMLEFSNSVASRVRSLPAGPARAKLEGGAGRLQQAIRAKAPPAEVAKLARGLASDLLAAHPVPLAPTEVPDVGRATALYAQSCASCHGLNGEGGQGEFAKLDPPPIPFADRERAKERSVFGLYQVITQGLEGTAMQSFASLPDEERWALAFHAGRLAFPNAAEGERIWKADESIRRRIPDMAALAAITPAALAAEIGEDKAYAVIAYLRANPGAVAAAARQGGSLRLVREKLGQSLAAYASGDRRAAGELALSAYLDGFEPVEAVLATRNGDLMAQVERAMGELRAAIAAGRPETELRQRLAALNPLLDEAEAALAPEAATDLSTFLGAFTILLREGLEALLVVIAMIAFLRKAERPEVLPYVHGGWVAALVAGAVTWAVATYVIGISGASRELTEGFGALVAALVLVSVGIWMHGKAQAEEWRRYIQEKMGRALSRGSAWFLFGLAFVVVYREVFETILFFAALWTADNGGTILAGALAAAVLLAAIAWAMLRYSRKLPITQFFAYSAILIAILAVVLAGKGVGALQEAGLVPLTLLPGVPRITLLGIFPTAEAIGAQLVTLAVLLYGFRANRRTRRAAAEAVPAE
jgi:high-affinity iron transporter